VSPPPVVVLPVPLLSTQPMVNKMEVTTQIAKKILVISTSQKKNCLDLDLLCSVIGF
jgi:hypothetical protein